MFNRSVVLLVFIAFACVSVNAQPALDTITAAIKHRPQLYGKLDSRNSFISNSRAKVFGCKLGINYGNRLYFGLGYSQLYPPAANFNTPFFYTDNNGMLNTAVGQLRLYYISTHAEYAYYKTKNWNMSILLQLGAGNTNYRYMANGLKQHTPNNFIFIYEPAISVEYKIIQWIGVGVDTGFRFVATNHRGVSRKFNSPTYAFNLLIYYNEIYKSVKKKVKERK